MWYGTVAGVAWYGTRVALFLTSRVRTMPTPFKLLKYVVA